MSSKRCCSPFDIKPSVEHLLTSTPSFNGTTPTSKSHPKTPTAGRKRSSAAPGPKASIVKTIPAGSVSKKSGSWTKAEVRALWEALDLLPVSMSSALVNQMGIRQAEQRQPKRKWDDVAADVPGRDKLVSMSISRAAMHLADPFQSCQNKVQ